MAISDTPTQRLSTGRAYRDLHQFTQSQPLVPPIQVRGNLRAFALAAVAGYEATITGRPVLRGNQGLVLVFGFEGNDGSREDPDTLHELCQ